MSSKYDAEYIYNEYNTKVKDRIYDIQVMVGNGYTYSQIASELGITNSMLCQMRANKAFTDLRDCFRIEKYMGEVENALLRKAIGYVIEEEQAFKVKRNYVDKRGKKATQEVIQKVKIKKYVEPDTQAIKFLLINKKSNEYHPESQKQIDNTMDLMLQRASEIVVNVKQASEKASEELKDANIK